MRERKCCTECSRRRRKVKECKPRGPGRKCWTCQKWNRECSFVHDYPPALKGLVFELSREEKRALEQQQREPGPRRQQPVQARHVREAAAGRLEAQRRRPGARSRQEQVPWRRAAKKPARTWPGLATASTKTRKSGSDGSAYPRVLGGVKAEGKRG